jgi:hypothetical protein
MESETRSENPSVTSGKWLPVTRIVTCHDESLLKACVSRQEKPSLCYTNGATRHAHIGDLRRFDICRKEQIAGAAHLRARTQSDVFLSGHHAAPRRVDCGSLFHVFVADISESDQRPWKVRFRAIEKQPHAQSIGPLHGHEPHLPADMVAVFQQAHLRLVVFGIALQLRDPLLDGAAKPGADLKAIVAGTVGDHGNLLGGNS